MARNRFPAYANGATRTNIVSEETLFNQGWNDYVMGEVRPLHRSRYLGFDAAQAANATERKS